MKKILNLFVFTLITVVFGITSVSAATLTYTEFPGGDVETTYNNPNAKYTVTISPTYHNYGADVIVKMSVDGTVAYCLEAQVKATNGMSGYTSKTLNQYISNASVREKLEKIAYVGYGYNGDTSNEMYAATQVRIWQELASVQKYTVTNVHSDIQAKINVINNRLKAPSIAGSKVTFNPDKVGKENAVTLTDTNANLNLYDVASADFEYEKSSDGKTLKIWRKEKSSKLDGKITFTFKKANGTSHAFVLGGQQTVGVLKLSATYAGFEITGTTTNPDVKISKEDALGAKEVIGAHMYITEKGSEDKIDEWDSDGKIHTISGSKFTNGKTYVIHEEVAPQGFQVANDFEFTYNRQGMDPIIVVDERSVNVKISKQDVTNGKEIKGAKLKLIDKETGEVIEEWTSGDKPHEISGEKFEDGKEYILRETLAPKGYNVSSDVVFTYNAKKMDPVVMKDEAIIENPDTGISFPLLITTLGCIGAAIGFTVLNKKNKFKKI